MQLIKNRQVAKLHNEIRSCLLIVTNCIITCLSNQYLSQSLACKRRDSTLAKKDIENSDPYQKNKH